VTVFPLRGGQAGELIKSLRLRQKEILYGEVLHAQRKKGSKLGKRARCLETAVGKSGKQKWNSSRGRKGPQKNEKDRGEGPCHKEKTQGGEDA